uniref:Uridylate-specific endoribonuclease n=1 Tax=Zosterops lateralis melanops TaxID=1220523 RepID=A0A8D2PJB0_ZOSLA
TWLHPLLSHPSVPNPPGSVLIPCPHPCPSIPSHVFPSHVSILVLPHQTHFPPLHPSCLYPDPTSHLSPSSSQPPGPTFLHPTLPSQPQISPLSSLHPKSTSLHPPSPPHACPSILASFPIPHSLTPPLHSPLFSYVSPALLARPTFSRLLALLDNYEPLTGRDERETAEEQREQREFLDAALATPVLQLLERFVLRLYPSAEAFRADLHSMWFGLYSRSSGKALDSSGFEHVFHGEVKKGSVSGCHNWVQLQALERAGRLEYQGYTWDGPWTAFPDVLSLRFRWDGYSKSRGSLLVGSSPEFDLALFTLCFLTRPDRQCQVSLGGEAATIQTYTWEKQRLVASAYPLTPQ